MRTSFLLIASLLLATGMMSTASAATQWGLGFLDSEVPIGVFVKPNEKMTLQGAFDYVQRDLPTGSSQFETELTVGAALVWDFWQGSNLGFGVSPGVTYQTQSPLVGDSTNRTTIPILLAGHWDPTEMFSLWFSHGVAIENVSPPTGSSSTNFYTTGRDLTNFGFTVWAP